MLKLLRILIYLLIFLIPWQTRLILRSGVLNGGNWEYGIVGIFATEILLWLILLLWILSGGLRNWRLTKKGKLIFLMILFFCLINFFIASDKLIFAEQLWHSAEAGLLFWLVKQSNPNRAILFFSFLGGLVVQSLLGLYQFFLQTTFASRWLGLTMHNPATAGSSILENWDGRWLRAYGGLSHPNVLGGYLAVGILLIFIFLALHFDNKKQRILTLASLGILTLALFFTFSRSAWLAVGASLSVFLIFLFGKCKESFKKIFPALILLVFIFVILTFVYQPLVLGRITGEGRLEVQSTTERLSGFSEAGQVFKNNFLFGTGLGNYTLAIHNQIDKSRNSWDYQPVHNAIVLAVAEVGVLGFLFFIYLIFLILNNESRITNNEERKFFRFSIIHSSLFILLFYLAFFDHYLWSSLSGWWLISVVFFISFLKPKTGY